MPVVLFIANLFGISVLRLAIYSAVTVAVATAGLTIRQHYVNKGWNAHKAAIEKQDDRARDAAQKVEQKTAKCQQGINGYWDVITQDCKLEETP